MPVQRSIFGRPVPQVSPRRMAILLGTIAVFAVFTLVFTLPNSIPTGPSLGRFADVKISIPKLPKKLPSASHFNPFRPAAHAPPVQKNSTDGESSWHSYWNWLSPFSSSVTLDQNRLLLPPLRPRPPIYTFYDHTVQKEDAVKDAENALLVTWRKAWWAQGFKPIILSPAEAMNSPFYSELQMKDIDAVLKTDLSRWLAWEDMGTGLLCNFLTLPMGPYEDPVLSYLRRGEYPLLTRFDNLGSSLFSGSKTDITAAVKAALANSDLRNAKDFITAVPANTFKIEPQHDALAYYDSKTIQDRYAKIADSIIGGGAKGLQLLNQLIVSHLHGTWQNIFSKGIAVMKPQPVHMSVIVEPASRLADFLAQCPESPMLTSCPPNQPRCRPCVSSAPMAVTTPPTYRNTSGLYIIGTVPHPFTMALLTSFRDFIDIPWIRREADRDPWVSALTKEILGTGVSGAPRVVKFKEAVASEHGTSHSLWVTAEKEIPEDLDWHFGFPVPRNVVDNGKSETPVPGPERRPKPVMDPRNGPVASIDDIRREKELLRRAKEFGVSRTQEEEKIRGAIEAWNLADTEAWKFAKAFLARSQMERAKWEEEEKRYAGGAGAERKEGSGRWSDDEH